MGMLQREAQSAPAQEVPEADVLAPTMSTEPSIEEPAVRRDLFRQHFDSLSDNKALQEAAGGGQQDQARQSMSSRFKAERASTCGPLHQGLRLQSQHSLQRLQQQAGGSILGAATAAPAAPVPPAPAASQRSTPPPAQEAAAATPPAQPAAASPFAATAAAPAELLGGNLSALSPSSPDDNNSPARVKRNRFIQPRAPQPMLYRSTSEPLLELAKPGRRDSDGSDNGEVQHACLVKCLLSLLVAWLRISSAGAYHALCVLNLAHLCRFTRVDWLVLTIAGVLRRPVCGGVARWMMSCSACATSWTTCTSSSGRRTRPSSTARHTLARAWSVAWQALSTQPQIVLCSAASTCVLVVFSWVPGACWHASVHLALTCKCDSAAAECALITSRWLPTCQRPRT
jgi:hypothetical protein